MIKNVIQTHKAKEMMNQFEITRKTFINPDDILWVTSDINYSSVYLSDGSFVTIALVLKNVENKLSNLVYILE